MVCPTACATVRRSQCQREKGGDELHRNKLQTEIGKAIYALRKETVEPVIGLLKEVLGFRQFSLRGWVSVTGEWCLVCLAFNLKRWHTLRAG